MVSVTSLETLTVYTVYSSQIQWKALCCGQKLETGKSSSCKSWYNTLRHSSKPSQPASQSRLHYFTQGKLKMYFLAECASPPDSPFLPPTSSLSHPNASLSPHPSVFLAYPPLFCSSFTLLSPTAYFSSNRDHGLRPGGIPVT